MHWIHPKDGPERFHNCQELFNCGANTECLLKNLTENDYISRHQLADGGVALVTKEGLPIVREKGLEEEEHFAVLYFKGPNPYEQCAYNIGYTKSSPTQTDIADRIAYMEHAAELEWEEHVAAENESANSDSEEEERPDSPSMR